MRRQKLKGRDKGMITLPFVGSYRRVSASVEGLD